MPAPVFIGGMARWRRGDLDAWVSAGCPQGPELSEAVSDALAEALITEFAKEQK